MGVYPIAMRNRSAGPAVTARGRWWRWGDRQRRRTRQLPLATLDTPAPLSGIDVAAWPRRYAAGEYRQVWVEMRVLGPGCQDEPALSACRQVARETMRRVRANVLAVHGRLLSVGYRFACPAEAVVPPDAATPRRLAAFEDAVGPIPLSLHAFYEIVGGVNWMQHEDQLAAAFRPDRHLAPEIELLGDEDPLVVVPLTDDFAVERGWDHAWFLAPDEFAKSAYSGGEPYHVLLPDPAADFPIRGMPGVEQHFVDYLRATFAGGGFRGATRPREEPHILAEGATTIRDHGRSHPRPRRTLMARLPPVRTPHGASLARARGGPRVAELNAAVERPGSWCPLSVPGGQPAGA